MSYQVKWKSPDGGYSETNWSTVSELLVASPGIGFDVYILEDGSGNDKIVIPGYPSTTCTSSTYAADHHSLTLGTGGYCIYHNPATVGTWSVSLAATYSDATVDTASTTFTTT